MNPYNAQRRPFQFDRPDFGPDIEPQPMPQMPMGDPGQSALGAGIRGLGSIGAALLGRQNPNDKLMKPGIPGKQLGGEMKPHPMIDPMQGGPMGGAGLIDGGGQPGMDNPLRPRRVFGAQQNMLQDLLKPQTPMGY